MSIFIDISEEYIDWLCFANAGMLHRGNLLCFEYVMRNLPSDNPIVEIGSFCGLSTNVIAYYKQKYSRKNQLFTADRWVFEGAKSSGFLGQSCIKHADYQKFIKESFLRNIKLFTNGSLPHTIELFSDEFFECWREEKRIKDVFGKNANLGGKISFCYIDGNHTYEYVKRDFENTDEFLEDGGFILFDDSADEMSFGIGKLMSEIIERADYELVLKNPNYLFRKMRVQSKNDVKYDEPLELLLKAFKDSFKIDRALRCEFLRLAYHLGQVDKINNIEKNIDNKSAEDYYYLARVSYNCRNCKDAIAYFQSYFEAINDDTKSSTSALTIQLSAQYYLGLSYMEDNRLAQAKECFNNCVAATNGRHQKAKEKLAELQAVRDYD